MKRINILWSLFSGVIVLTILILICEVILAQWSSVNEPVHSVFETLGLFASILLAIILLQQIDRQKRNSYYVIISSGLIAMGILDGFHAITHAGNTFVWLHSMSVLMGGILFALIALPLGEIPKQKVWRIPVFIATVSIAIGIFSMFSDALPIMIRNGNFTLTATIINVVGGGLFVLAGVSFLVRLWNNRNTLEILLVFFCLLVGSSALLFPFGQAWSAEWWMWHFLRLIAYFILLGYVLIIFVENTRITFKLMEDLRITSSYARNLIEASLDPLVTIGKDGKITDVNEATVNITGYSRDSLIGTDFSDYYLEPEKAREGYLQVFEKGFVKDYPLTIQHKSSRLTHVSYNASVYKDIEGKVIGVFAAARDITEIKKAEEVSNLQNWLKTGYARLSNSMAGNIDMALFASGVITELCKYLDAKIGAFYILRKNSDRPEFRLTGSYAYTRRKNLSDVFQPGEGMIGQAAFEKQQILIKNVPEDYIRITSGLGETVPRFICITPVIHENEVTAVIEIGTLEEITDLKLEYLKECTTSIAITLATLKSREELDNELLRSKELAEELQRQQEELKASNEELEEQTQLLRQSDERMKTQQEELRVANEELEEKNNSLQIQKNELTGTRDELEIQADELAIASKYKSEFLANMSHELRTPLNSLLILSKVLADNKKANLTKDQVESANIIYRSGNDLLSLINEILDLSKIEAGQMEVNIEKSDIRKIADRIISDFQHVVEEKGLKLNIEIDKKAPEFIESDIKRLEQIIRNLISNAIKFTRKGSVTICFKRPAPDVRLFRSGLSPDNCFAVSVTDTGIGIPAEKQKIIFEAFQQADGGTSRQYGGTGLGLSISRELATMLGGEIQLFSEPGKGSEFTVYLPIKPSGVITGMVDKQHSDNYPKKLSLKTHSKLLPGSVSDDREVLKEKNSNSILIIEDDRDFAKLLYDQSHEKGFKVLVALTGEEGIKLADEFIPAAVILDLHLPGISGWDVLDILKDSPSTRHIPVHIMSVDDPTIEVFRKGAIGYLVKPPRKEELDGAFNKIEEMISRPIKELLVVEDNKNACDAIVKLIGNGDVHSKTVSSGKNAIKELKARKYDCMIMDLGLPDMTGFELLEKLRESETNIPPVIVYTGKDLTLSEEMSLREYAESIIIKGVKSEERLLDEASLFLHRMVEKFPEQKKKMILNLHDSDTMFRDKKVLIVDDDMRNVFALSKVLSDKGLKTLKAEDGMKALDILNKEPGIDLVIMDIMMPEMDGYETMKRIREQKKFAHLPIIALTAKAMKKDYEQCMASGANDYMSKPVDTNRLISMLRIWLYR
jgi:PAS domain S-box-containing protein